MKGKSVILLQKLVYHLSLHPFLSNPLLLLERELSKCFTMTVMIPKAVLGMLEQLLITELLNTLHGEEEVCYFDLTIDFLNGDIVLI